MKRFNALLVFVPITAGLMLLRPVDEVFAADATASPQNAATVSSAVATASSAIATATSAIATASSAIATASSAIATASSVIGTDSSTTAVDAIACDDDKADLCDTAAATSTTTITSTATSVIAGDDDGCSNVASTLRLGLGADNSLALQVDDSRGGTGRSLDIVGPRRRVDGFNRIVVQPRTISVKMVEKVMLTALSMFFEKLELALYLSLYKLKLLYTTLIAPVLGI